MGTGIGTPRLPEHLELLLTDEPVLDVYSYGPWVVPLGLYEEIAERAATLNRDPRALEVTCDLPDVFGEGTTATGADLWCLLEFLIGASALRAGSRHDVLSETMGTFLSAPLVDRYDLAIWSVRPGGLRPPGDWLLRAAGDDPERRRIARELALESLDVFAGLAPVEARRQAVVDLFARWDTDTERQEVAAVAPWFTLPLLWAECAAEDEAILAALPELHGAVGYLEWAVSGLAAAHRRLLAVDGGDSFPRAVAKLLVHANRLHPTGFPSVPPGFDLAMGPEDCLSMQVQFHQLRDPREEGLSLDAWRAEVRSWLSKGLVAGEVDACRAWLDMATRVCGIAMGLPDNAVGYTNLLPVALFEHDLRQLHVPHQPIVNPLVAKLGTSTEAPPPANWAADLADQLVGQPDLAAEIRQVGTTSPTAEVSAVRLLVAGPEGTGRRTAVRLLTTALGRRPNVSGAWWMSDRLFTNYNPTGAVQELTGCVDKCLEHGFALVVDGLDRILANEICGAAVGEQLRHVLALYPRLEFLAICRPDGDLRVFEANPALFDRLTVVRTHDLLEEDLTELARRAVYRRGADITDDAAEASGRLVAGTASHGNLRGARLVDHLATKLVTAARARVEGDATPEVVVGDVPARLFPVGGVGSDPRADLDACVGLGPVKEEIGMLVAEARAEALRRAAGMPASDHFHLAFSGEPGTGKTMVARILGRLLADTGLLPSGHLVSVDRADLVGPGGPRVEPWVERALGGVLCVEDAHELMPVIDDNAERNRAALAALVTALDAHPRDLVVVLTGSDAGVNGLLKADPALAARFSRTVRFPTLGDDELVTLFEAKAAHAGFSLADGVVAAVRELLRTSPGGGRIGGRTALTTGLLERTIARQARRILADGVVDEHESLHELLVEDVPGSLVATTRVDLPDDPLADIDRLIGLGTVKREIRLLVAEAKAERLRRDAGMPLTPPTRHLVFTGNPGTAKTTMARLLAAAYGKLGLLSSGHLVEVSRGDLIAEYLGQTPPKVRAAVSRALGGVLFIDEAYALSPPRSYEDYGSEAVAELLRLMEEHRDDLVVVAAGYPDQMSTFLESNPGLASRFPTVVQFPDYSDDELVAIFELVADDAGYVLADGTLDVVRRRLASTPRDRSFGNGRVMRTLLDRAIAAQAERITAMTAPDHTDVRTIHPDDVRHAAAADLPADPDVPVGLYL